MPFKIFIYACFTWLFSCIIFSPSVWANSQSDEKTLNGLHLPSTDLSYLWLFSQKLYLPGSLATENKQKLKTASGFNADLEIPVWNYLNAGFYFQYYTGLQPEIIPMEDSATANVRSEIGYNIVGLGMFLKPKVEIPFAYGNLAFSLRIPLGFEFPVGVPLIPFNNSSGAIPNALSAYGIKTGATLGLEYFPVYILGFFVEAGYQVAYQYFLLTSQDNQGKYHKIDGTFHYLIHGGILMAGIKIAY